MGNYILGSGALSSRLGNRIRQQDGLSYGVSSSLSASSFDQRASFTITAICNPQNIGRLEKAVQEELARLLRDGVTQEELEAARKGYLQSQQVTRSSDAALAGILSALRHSGRTMTHEADGHRIATITALQKPHARSGSCPKNSRSRHSHPGTRRL
jgi:zinc protease